MKDSDNGLERARECSVIRVLLDGSLLLKLDDKEQAVYLHGIEIPKPPPQEYFDWFAQRLPRIRGPLRCVFRGSTETGQMKAQLFYFAWQDKSGDVWLDLALALLSQGLAKVAPGNFPEREEYLKREKAAPE